MSRRRDARRSPRGLAKPTAVHLMLGLAGLTVAVPLYWAVKSSLGTNAELGTSPVQWLPTSLHFESDRMP